MNSFHESHEPGLEVEALIRSAQSYVQVSEELRPRVLEAVRLQHGERRIRRQIEHLAILAMALAILAASWRSTSNRAPGLQPGNLFTAGLRHPHLETDVGSRSGDANWRLVEVYTELRRRQAEVFRPATELPAARAQSASSPDGV